MSQTYSTKSNAVRAALKELGHTAQEGTHFVVAPAEGRKFTWAPASAAPAVTLAAKADAPAADRTVKADAPKAPAKPKAAPAPKAAKAEKPAAKTWTVGGKVYHNETRAADAQRRLDEKAAKEAAKAAPTPAREAAAGRKAIAEAAARGELPPVPDFSKPTHRGYQKVHGEVVAMVEAGDIAGLEKKQFRTSGSSGKMLDTYRLNAIAALKALRAAKRRAAKGDGSANGAAA